MCEALTRPNMRFVPIKTRIRVLLSELSIVLPLEAAVIRGQAHKHLEELPRCCNTVIGDAVSELIHLDARFHEYDKHIAHIVKEDEQSRQLMQLGGIGPTTFGTSVAPLAKATISTVVASSALGLGWCQVNTAQAAKMRQLRIPGRETRTCPGMLIMGAKAELSATKNKTNP